MRRVRERYENLLVSKSLTLKLKEGKKKELEEVQSKIKSHVDAREVLLEISNVIQRQFKKRIESLITYAIQSVYSRPLSFELHFLNKRNNIEMMPIVKENGEELKPNDDDLGGGILDVIAFGFRIVLWYMEDPKSRNVLFLDEPFRFLGDLVPRAGKMLKYISKKFNLQVILVTHDKQITKYCDKVYGVEHNGVESIVTRRLKRIN